LETREIRAIHGSAIQGHADKKNLELTGIIMEINDLRKKGRRKKQAETSKLLLFISISAIGSQIQLGLKF
jgi:hypothetical protein